MYPKLRAQSRPRGNGALHGDDEAVGLPPGRPLERRADLTKVGGPRFRRRSPRRDQHYVSQAFRDVLVVQEAELCAAGRLPDELLESGLVNGRLASLEGKDRLSTDVHPQNVMACSRQAGGSHLEDESTSEKSDT